MPLAGIRIVLVEDHALLREMLNLVLDDVHADVTTYTNVTSARNHPDWDVTDAAVVDWMLPQNNGVSLIDWLAEHHPHVRRIVITAAPEALLAKYPDINAEVVSKGADDRGQFPWSLLQLLNLRRGKQ